MHLPRLRFLSYIDSINRVESFLRWEEIQTLIVISCISILHLIILELQVLQRAKPRKPLRLFNPNSSFPNKNFKGIRYLSFRIFLTERCFLELSGLPLMSWLNSLLSAISKDTLVSLCLGLTNDVISNTPDKWLPYSPARALGKSLFPPCLSAESKFRLTFIMQYFGHPAVGVPWSIRFVLSAVRHWRFRDVLIVVDQR